MSASNMGRLLYILHNQMPTTLNSYRDVFEELRETYGELLVEVVAQREKQAAGLI